MTDTHTDEFLAEAYREGKQVAESVASWVTDGNESDDSRRRKLEMLEAGDPMVESFLPNWPSLSGEWADDPTPLSLARDITGEDEPDAELIGAIADEFDRGVSEHFESACEAELRKWVS